MADGESETKINGLTVPDVLALSAMINATQSASNVRMRRLLDSGDVVEGVARTFVIDPDRLTFPGKGNDLRDCYLHVSGTFEHFWPVRELITEYQSGLFVVGD